MRLLVAIAFCFATASAPAQSTIVFLVRHGEKAAQPANDPPLSPAGQARARALSEALANARVDVIISTPYERTLATVRPLATKLGIVVDTIPIGGGVAAYARAVAEAVRRHAGKSVVVVGHSNTIMHVAAALGAPTMPDLCDGDYDQIITLQLMDSGPPRVTRTRFGAPASDPGCGRM